ncbi:MAG: YbjN domain-containing protein [Nostoc sp.]|uniref:YbjN domain-containing protein n=1 Tax=Nostoc sp. TaxID=1180 RepID=UPI002FEF8186
MRIDSEGEIIEMLNNRGWQLFPDKKQGLYITFCEGENGTYKVYLNVMNLDKDLLISYSYIPVKAPKDKIEKMALLLNKINRNLSYGNFEMDYSNGEITFRNGIHFLGEKFTEYMALNTISPCAFTVDKYFPAIKALIDREISPKEALELVEP